MEQSKGLLYPAMHKFYSALNSLEKFQKGKNFFDNISYLDNFFSEYRNITFVLQKSLAHTKYLKIYEEKREKYLINDTCKWFLEKRNEVLKQHPFNLEKKIIVTIYSPKTSFPLPEQVFTIENDIKYTTLIDSLRSFFVKINSVEVFFSVEFSFYEKGHKKELYEEFILGISQMKIFLQGMKNAINENCRICDELQEKIKSLNFYQVPKNILFIDDYVYYVQQNKFEKGAGIEISMPFLSKRTPISYLMEKMSHGINNDIFVSFMTMYLLLFSREKSLMPTFMIIYEDDTFELKSFVGFIKTTFYRKVNEIANQIEKENIKSIFYVTEVLYFSNSENQYTNLLKMTFRDRAKYKTSESLYFFQLDKKLSFKSFCFDSEKIDDIEYIFSVMTELAENLSDMFFLNPIRNEFERLSKNKE